MFPTIATKSVERSAVIGCLGELISHWTASHHDNLHITKCRMFSNPQLPKHKHEREIIYSFESLGLLRYLVYPPSPLPSSSLQKVSSEICRLVEEECSTNMTCKPLLVMQMQRCQGKGAGHLRGEERGRSLGREGRGDHWEEGEGTGHWGRGRSFIWGRGREGRDMPLKGVQVCTELNQSEGRGRS